MNDGKRNPLMVLHYASAWLGPNLKREAKNCEWFLAANKSKQAPGRPSGDLSMTRKLKPLARFSFCNCRPAHFPARNQRGNPQNAGTQVYFALVF